MDLLICEECDNKIKLKPGMSFKRIRGKGYIVDDSGISLLVESAFCEECSISRSDE